MKLEFEAFTSTANVAIGSARAGDFEAEGVSALRHVFRNLSHRDTRAAAKSWLATQRRPEALALLNFLDTGDIRLKPGESLSTWSPAPRRGLGLSLRSAPPVDVVLDVAYQLISGARRCNGGKEWAFCRRGFAVLARQYRDLERISRSSLANNLLSFPTDSRRGSLALMLEGAQGHFYDEGSP